MAEAFWTNPKYRTNFVDQNLLKKYPTMIKIHYNHVKGLGQCQFRRGRAYICSVCVCVCVCVCWGSVKSNARWNSPCYERTPNANLENNNQ